MYTARPGPHGNAGRSAMSPAFCFRSGAARMGHCLENEAIRIDKRLDLCIIKYRPAVGRVVQNIIADRGDGGILAVRSAQIGCRFGQESSI